MSEKLPTREEILDVLDDIVYEIYNGLIVNKLDTYDAWVLDNAPKVIDNFEEFSKKYVADLLEEYKRRFDKEKYGEI